MCFNILHERVKYILHWRKYFLMETSCFHPKVIPNDNFLAVEALWLSWIFIQHKNEVFHQELRISRLTLTELAMSPLQ